MSDTNLVKWLALAVCACAFGLIGLRFSSPITQSAPGSGEAMSRAEARLTNLVAPFLDHTSYRVIANPRNTGDLVLLVEADITATQDVQALRDRLLPLLATATGRTQDTIQLRIEPAPFGGPFQIASFKAIADWTLMVLIALGAFGLALLSGKTPRAHTETTRVPDETERPGDDESYAATAAIQIKKWLSEAKTG